MAVALVAAFYALPAAYAFFNVEQGCVLCGIGSRAARYASRSHIGCFQMYSRKARSRGCAYQKIAPRQAHDCILFSLLHAGQYVTPRDYC